MGFQDLGVIFRNSRRPLALGFDIAPTGLLELFVRPKMWTFKFVRKIVNEASAHPGRMVYRPNVTHSTNEELTAAESATANIAVYLTHQVW